MAKTFEKKTLQELRVAMNKALEGVKKEFGLEDLYVGSCSFEEFEATFKVELKYAHSPEQVAYKAELINLPSDILGKFVMCNGQRMKVVDINLRKRKNPVIVQDIHDKQFCMPVNEVMNRLVEVK